jgi:hypothetical protein
MEKINLIGQKFGMLTVKKYCPNKKHTVWQCRCDCGKMRKVISYNLRSGNSRSCGCQKGNANKGKPAHLKGYQYKTRYPVWLQNLKKKVRGEDEI